MPADFPTVAELPPPLARALKVESMWAAFAESNVATDTVGSGAWGASNVDGLDEASVQYFRAEHALRSGNTVGPPRRAIAWAEALEAYEKFWVVTGAAARENTRTLDTLPVAERRMGQWARYQRRFRYALCHYQAARLTASPAFEWDMQQAAWLEHLNACASFYRVTDRWPRVGAQRPEEHAHARWLGRQLALAKSNRLPANRAQALKRMFDLVSDGVGRHMHRTQSS